MFYIFLYKFTIFQKHSNTLLELIEIHIFTKYKFQKNPKALQILRYLYDHQFVCIV